MKKFLSLALAGLMTLTVAGCGNSSKAGGVVTVGATSDLTGQFSPAYWSTAYDKYVVMNVYDTLMAYDIDSKLQPSLAEKASVTKDGKSVTYELRKDVKFSDGTPLTAKDVEFTFKVISDPSYDGQKGETVKFLVGYDKYSDKNNKTEPEYPGIKVEGDYKITFTTTVPSNESLSGFGIGLFIMSKNQFKDDYKYGDTKKVKESKTPLGTGPYVLKKWEAGVGAILEKNDKYWGSGYNIQKVIIKPVKASADYEELVSKNIDILPSNIEPSKIGPATTNKDITYNSYPRGGLGYITYNAFTGVTAEKAVRQALSYAFDRNAFVNSFYECKNCKFDKEIKIGYVPTTFQNPLSAMGDVVRGTKKLDGLETYDFNMEKAKKILDDAGWKAGSNGKRSKNGKPLEIKVLATEDNAILENLIPMWNKSWGESLGADIKVATVTFNTLVDKIQNEKYSNDWNIFFLAAGFETDSMNGLYTKFISSQAKDGGGNFARDKDPVLDGLLDKAVSNMDTNTQVKSFEDVAKRVNENATVIPVYGNTYFDFYNKRIKNLKTGPLYPWQKALKDATVE